MKSVHIAIAGLGTVGTGVVDILLRHGDVLSQRAGATLSLKHALVRDAGKARDVELPAGVVTEDAARVIEDPDVSVLIEVMGGVDAAGNLVSSALKAGKSVVTANKALIAEHGPKLFKLAADADVSLAFDAAVAGGIPIVTNITQCLAANRIQSIRGILNGTCNYVLSQMEQENSSYLAALEAAKRHGYAEADPTLDVDGTDATQKLAILAQLGMQRIVDWRDISRLGIQQIDVADIDAARQLGYRIRLIGVAQRCGDDQMAMHVAPTLLTEASPLAHITGPDNAVVVEGDAVGEVLYQGAGAGRLPTASAVVADLLDTVSGRAHLTFRGLCELKTSGTMHDPADVTARYYLRLPGVAGSPLSGEIAKIMVRHGIAIGTSLNVDSARPQTSSSVVLVTQRASTRAVEAAASELSGLDNLRGEIVRARVE